ncbi:partial Pyruvate formate-lyase 1-activating enzyme, partial [Anaerolineae bacterium]
LSVAMVGCSLTCKFCFNAPLSQYGEQRGMISSLGKIVPPSVLVKAAQQANCSSISFTYTEPSLYLEYILAVAEVARCAQLPLVLVTNGYLTNWTCEQLGDWVDALNIDLKSFRDEFYQSICGAHLQPVLDTINYFVARGTHVEISTPLITGLNDSPEELTDLTKYLCDERMDLPWHVLPVQPAYRMQDWLPTRIDSLKRAVEIGKAAGLRSVYCEDLGIVPGKESHGHQNGTSIYLS